MLRNAGKHMDFTHYMNDMSFGDKAQMNVLKYRFGEDMTNELSGVRVHHGDVA